ncbi:hypothetical protein SADUNF_Sadunf03G0082800 [Salix dunnii]|uniref:Bifunctional inhibitor/plant lipid transfer protein/seed storage helical domain-containing protein n=1 Tax=Salix dunnii TaxID=1413687 RepID=A0A835KC14_9ROSI|nr:hypothetical protein SADUNF_Sadunf03G0082800 [Salix dunnii]
MASSFTTVMVAVVFFSSTTTLTKAQDSSTSCATKLVPCQDFLATTTTPPASCCNPIKEAVANELPCLCKIYNDPVLLPSLGINVTQALLLSKRCNVTSDLSSCNGITDSVFGLQLQRRPARLQASPYDDAQLGLSVPPISTRTCLQECGDELKNWHSRIGDPCAAVEFLERMEMVYDLSSSR